MLRLTIKVNGRRKGNTLVCLWSAFVVDGAKHFYLVMTVTYPFLLAKSMTHTFLDSVIIYSTKTIPASPPMITMRIGSKLY